MADLILTLSGEIAATLERFTTEGGFSSPEAALAALLEQQGAAHDQDLERWLTDVGSARYDALKADPTRAVSVADARVLLLKNA
jgi:hypothetical protein